MLLTPQQVELVGQLYLAQRWSVDRLPYTPEFDEMLLLYSSRFPFPGDGMKRQAAFWRLLLSMRKDGSLPTKTNINRKVSRERLVQRVKASRDKGTGLEVFR